jgi:hypothetical protein
MTEPRIAFLRQDVGDSRPMGSRRKDDQEMNDHRPIGSPVYPKILVAFDF